jgi:hypothetical protein
MISLVLTIILTCWTLSTLYFVRHVLVPLIINRLDELRWQKMHPGMPSWRRSGT